MGTKRRKSAPVRYENIDSGILNIVEKKKCLDQERACAGDAQEERKHYSVFKSITQERMKVNLREPLFHMKFIK